MEVNGDFVIQSLSMQLTDYAMKVAERDARITEQYGEIKRLKKEIEDMRKKEIEDMDSEK